MISRDVQRLAVQYKIAHRDDLPKLAALQGIDSAAQGATGNSPGFDWLARKVSLLFPYFINHVFTGHLQASDGSLLNRALLRIFGKAFYNRG